MDNVFIKYMSERARKAVSTDGKVQNPGPVITISRQYGCPAERISELLTQQLTELSKAKGENIDWRWISKEIIEESAKELKLAPSLVKDLKEYKLRGFMDHLALFFSDWFYTGDSKIMVTIAKFIYDAASQGHMVILGRAGEAITQNIKHSLHIKLEAPIDWRADQIQVQNGISHYEAKNECLEMDVRRDEFREHFESGKEDVDFFDVYLNTKTLTDEAIIGVIIELAKRKELI